jgi:peptide subunit release factor 1 (eRF1)
MFEKIDLKQLAELSGPERAFLSLYASGPEGLRSLNDRETRIRSFLKEDADELEHFEENMKLVRGWLEEHPEESKGLAVFACWALDRVHGFPLTMEVPNRLRVGTSPDLKPLAELQDEYENFVVVVADNHGARIDLVTGARVTEEERVSADIKNRVKKGGWSQKRYSRRRDNELLHYAKEVAERLQEMAEHAEFDRIVLLGSAETLNELEEHLPESLAEKVVGAKSVDLHEPDESVLEEAFELFFAAERAEEQRTWDRIKEEFLTGGLAAVGATNVLKAAAVGRVETLVVTRDAEIKGTRCRECENVVHGTPKTCQICGSSSVFEVDLVEELVRLIALTSGETDFVDPIEGLTEMGDVAALLRY